MQYLQWLQKQKDFISCEGKKIEVFSLLHNSQMNNIMSEWATHFRNQYCNDSIIDRLKPPSKSRKDYLNEIKFPDKSITPGPSIRAGDFGEILIADFLEYIENYWVPRTRYNDKNIRQNIFIESITASKEVVDFLHSINVYTLNDLLKRRKNTY